MQPLLRVIGCILKGDLELRPERQIALTSKLKTMG